MRAMAFFAEKGLYRINSPVDSNKNRSEPTPSLFIRYGIYMLGRLNRKFTTRKFKAGRCAKNSAKKAGARPAFVIVLRFALTVASQVNLFLGYK